MILKLRIKGIWERESGSREVVLDVAVHSEGRAIGNLTMPKEDWPGVAEVGNEWVVAG